ncbi:hypothetical protein [Pseudomonas sp. ICMP 561]|uniref:hypothetical protein n=1 Tax=Pseudomonas sp. ICMP 561 TaxID=1718918 RepID=UPI000C0818C1|nr:hypothetical protein [Pseudomonas sp. ICMP 561]PHN28624.1 hypothetical protein AO242_24255 [Pseudomonas sp. ICMP 561]
MAKRLLNLHIGQWRGNAENHKRSTQHMIAVPLLLLATLLILDGIFSMSVISLAVGIIGMIAASGIERHGQSLAA